MLRGHRGKVYAAGLATLLIFTLGVGGWIYSDAAQLQRAYEHGAAQHAKAYANRAHVAAKRRCLPLPPQAQRQCIREEAETARQSERDEYDLQAQLVMSAWTRAMGLAAIVGMAFGIFGVGLVFVTFRETRNANRIARDALEGQLRPWIDFRLSKNGTLSIVDEALELTASVEFSNIGQSPAIDLTYMPTMIMGEEVNPHFRQLVDGFSTDSLDWADKNLFPGRVWNRQAGAVHTGARNGPTKITYVLIARYRTPFSAKFRFTAKAYDVQLMGHDLYGGYQTEGPLIDLTSRPAGEETVMLVERQQFAGFAT